MPPDQKATASELLAASLRVRLSYDLAPIAVIGPGAGEMAAALRGVGYERIWQREGIDAVLSLYQPGRVFDAVVLTGCLEHLADGTRAFDQIDASLADAGFVCVTIAAQAAERLDRHQLTTDHQQPTTARMDSLMRLFADHGFQLHVMDAEAPHDATKTTLIGIFSRRVRKC